MSIYHDRVKISVIPTGVPNLDSVIGGGVPALSTNIIAGAPGAGKTTLAQQIVFHNASPECKAIYFSAMGEPITKLLRYQQQYDFFDPRKLDDSIFFIDLSSDLRESGLDAAMQTIRTYVEEIQPSIVVLDSFRAIIELAEHSSPHSLRTFIFDLTVSLSAWGVTSFLAGEYSEQEIANGPEFTVADGIIWLTQEVHNNATIRKLQVRKWRGMKSQPGKHTFRIDHSGIHVFPRLAPMPESEVLRIPGDRVKLGVRGLDEMMNGGMPRAESMLIAGSSGTGKTLLSLHFIAEGIKAGEASVLVSFEERPEDHVRKAKGFGWDLEEWERQRLLRTIYLRPIDLSVDEVLSRVAEISREINAARVVINSISGFELALTESDKDDFREALYRIIANLTGKGISVLMTTEVPDFFGGMNLTPGGLSFLADNVVLLRFVEIESRLHKAVTVMKMRTSDHDKDLREYNITDKGVVVAQPFTQYNGVLSGIPTLKVLLGPQPFTAGLAHEEEDLMHVLLALHEASAQQLAESIDMPEGRVRETLDKLTETGYVSMLTRGGEARYRVVMMTPGTTVVRRQSKDQRDRSK